MSTPISTLYSPIDYYGLGDEATFQRRTYAKGKTSVDDLCFCRHCLAAFREYLKKAYGTLAKLNAGWDTAYKSWDDVMPLPGRQARLLANWSRWIDFRIFIAKSYAGSVTGVQTEVRRVDPAARASGNVHWESPWTAYMAYHLHGPGGNATAEIYPRTFEQGRSYAPHPAYRRIHIGYPVFVGHPRSVTDHYAWRNLAYGGGRVDFYNGIEALYGGVLTPTFEVTVSGKWLQGLDTAMRKTGVGKAVLTSKPDAPVVGVMESCPSQYAYYLEPQHFDADGYYRRDDYAMWNHIKYVWGSYGRLAEDLGLGWRLVNEEECTRRVPDGIRVMILPGATCLSSQSAAALERFVKGGGVVIADVRLGERDRHGRPHPSGGPGWLTRVFGVRRSKPGRDETGAKLTIRASSALAVSTPMASSCHEPGLRAAGATAHGAYADGSPHTLVRAMGTGGAVYLNYEMWSYNANRSPAARKLVNALAEKAGARPVVRLVDDTGSPVLSTLCLRRTRGPLSYVVILRNNRGPSPPQADLVLARPAHLYDVGRHTYLGHRAKLRVKPSATRGLLVAVYPYRVDKVALSLPARAVQGTPLEYRATVSVSDGKPGDHVLRVEVTRPDGTPCPYWTRNVVAEGGVYAPRLRLAHDEMPGRWQVKVTEVASGRSATGHVTIGPK